MTVTHRKPQHQPEEFQVVNEPGDQIECDSCACDLTHTIRIKCADPVCEPGDGVDICPRCFCAGKEFGKHKRGHAYRVIEFNSYPIFSEDWGADEELLLLKGISLHGLGNWKKIAEHVGTRTKDEVEQHYNAIYIESPNWPLPQMDLKFNVEPEEFQQRKRRRISEMNAKPIPPPKVPPTSAPGVHEISTFLPGRLEFEHELDNEAEDLVKDLEFGVCLQYGGDQIIEDENDLDVKARIRWEEEKKTVASVSATPVPRAPVAGKGVYSANGVLNPMINGAVNGYHASHGVNGVVKPEKQPTPSGQANGNAAEVTEDGNAAAEEVAQAPPIETPESLAFKLTLIEMYSQRVDKRIEAKALMFDRGLLEYKKTQAADKKRPREDREILHRLRPFGKLQTAEDYESFSTDILYEAMLRKKIQDLQHYRRLGLSTAADIDKYESDLLKRTQAKVGPREYHASDRTQFRLGGRQSSGPDPRRSSLVSFGGESEDRKSHERETTPRLGGPSSVTGPGVPVRRPPPLNLANSPSLHLLTQTEQALCSQLRILPKPYLVIKETLVREYARRGGKLRRREARDLVKIDVNKTSRVWDFLVQAGFLKITPDQPAAAPTPLSLQPSSSQDSSTVGPAGSSSQPQVNGSPFKDSHPLPRLHIPMSASMPPVPLPPAGWPPGPSS